MKIIMLIIMFLLIGAFFIISENKLDLKNAEGRDKLGSLYYSWIGEIFENSRQVAGYAVKLDWLPGNKTE